MKISTTLDYAGGDMAAAARRITDLELAGLDTVWVAEAYGFDAPTQMGYLAAITKTVTIGSAILPIYTRTPTLIAMTAASLDALSGGRAALGLGASGPQVIEGFHGVPYDAPLGRTKEIIEICHKVWARERVVHEGAHYTLPLPPDQGTGLGKPLKLINKPLRSHIPIWVAAIGPKNVQLMAEAADGWLPFFFLAEKAKATWGADLDAGFARRNPDLGPLQISATALVAIGEGDEIRDLRNLARPMMALYIGGMGARGRNFYNNLVRSYGYEAEAELIQDLYLDGKKDEAAAAVPEALLDAVSICGPQGYVADRIAALAEAGVTQLNVNLAPTGDQTPASLVETIKKLSS
ncbi:MAG TPA: LLM class F420-dependent oxidoreductase [Mycobacteriales bacterium]|jgi:F420-dependent oxidoreductase-like protein|nr:LLM class F420-dependent oxidoreductase [Mycobacteriales bacterium]